MKRTLLQKVDALVQLKMDDLESFILVGHCTQSGQTIYLHRTDRKDEEKFQIQIIVLVLLHRLLYINYDDW